MDGITIFASRYRSKPVQLFTGYLDETPYLQLFPGTCTLRASCTLKRLLHTYWDAGLPHTIEFLSKFGWMPNTQTGTIFSQVGQTEKSNINQGNNVQAREIDKAVLTDGSVGNLLWNVLFEIGGWREDRIMIEKLPDGIITTVTDIMDTFQESNEETQTEVEKFFKDLLGPYNPGGTDSIPGVGTGASGRLNIDAPSPPTGATVTPEQVGIEMLRVGFPIDAQVLANGMGTIFGDPEGGGTATGESGGQPTYNGSCCYGYWQINLDVHDVTEDCCNNLNCSTKYALTLWKAAGNCFNCGNGVNNGQPWQAGTDTGVKYLDVAERIIAEVKDKSDSATGHNYRGKDGVGHPAGE